MRLPTCIQKCHFLLLSIQKCQYRFLLLAFKKCLECLDYKLSPLFEASTTPVNKLFEVFLVKFAETVDQFAPKRKATRKEKKLGLKPWISRGLLVARGKVLSGPRDFSEITNIINLIAT